MTREEIKEAAALVARTLLPIPQTAPGAGVPETPPIV